MEGLSRLSKKCQECPFVETCNHKQMEALAYLNDAGQTASMDAAAPVLRETMIINAGDGTMIEVYKEEIQKQIYKELGIPGYLMPLA